MRAIRQQNDYRLAAERVDRALELRQKSGDARGIAEAKVYRGLLAERQVMRRRR